MSFKIEYGDQLDDVIALVNGELAKENIPIQFVDDEKEHDGYMIYSLEYTDAKEETISKEQIERYSAALRCLEMARAEMPDVKNPEEDALIKVALEYGEGMNLTREECEKLMNMKVIDLITLGI